MKGLLNKHDEWKENEEEIQGIIVDYFSDLFKASTETNGLIERERVHVLSKE